MDTNIKRGDIFYADLSLVVGSEQGGNKTRLIVQNDTGNRHSPTVIAAAITSQFRQGRLPTHISLPGMTWDTPSDPVVLLEQIRTIDKRHLREHMGHVDEGYESGGLRHRGKLRTSGMMPQAALPQEAYQHERAAFRIGFYQLMEVV